MPSETIIIQVPLPFRVYEVYAVSERIRQLIEFLNNRHELVGLELILHAAY